MTQMQALEILTNATGLLQVTRQDHMAILEALKVFERLITPDQEDH